eukprot:1557314-Rhodomonas_salina.1
MSGTELQRTLQSCCGCSETKTPLCSSRLQRLLAHSSRCARAYGSTLLPYSDICYCHSVGCCYVTHPISLCPVCIYHVWYKYSRSVVAELGRKPLCARPGYSACGCPHPGYMDIQINTTARTYMDA